MSDQYEDGKRFGYNEGWHDAYVEISNLQKQLSRLDALESAVKDLANALRQIKDQTSADGDLCLEIADAFLTKHSDLIASVSSKT